MSTIKVAIIGASGYTGSELVRLLLLHPRAELVAVTSRSNVGHALVGPLPAACRAFRVPTWPSSMPTWTPSRPAGPRLPSSPSPTARPRTTPPRCSRTACGSSISAPTSACNDAAVYEEFYGAAHPAPDLLDEAVYGLPEVRPEAIRDARLVASPGCYPTTIILPLLPLLRDGLVDPATIIANSTSGVSGAGRKADLALLFVRVQRKRPRLRPAEAPPSLRDRAGTLHRRRRPGRDLLHPPPGPGQCRHRHHHHRHAAWNSPDEVTGALEESLFTLPLRAPARAGRLPGHQERDRAPTSSTSAGTTIRAPAASFCSAPRTTSARAPAARPSRV